MVKLEVVKGRKAEGDMVVLVTANREPLKIEHVLKILDIYFKSEDACYPPSEGYMGRRMLFKAICEVYKGKPVPLVVQKYRLKRTGKGFTLTYKI